MCHVHHTTAAQRSIDAWEEWQIASRAWVALGGMAAVDRELQRRVTREQAVWAATLVGRMGTAGVRADEMLRKIANARRVVTSGVKVIRRAIVDGETAAGVRADSRGGGRWTR